MNWGYVCSTVILVTIVLLIVIGRIFDLDEKHEEVEPGVKISISSLNVATKSNKIERNRKKPRTPNADAKYLYRERLKTSNDTPQKTDKGSFNRKTDEKKFKSDIKQKGNIPEINLSFGAFDPVKVSTNLGFQLIAVHDGKILCGVNVADYSVVNIAKQQLSQFSERGLSADGLPFAETAKDQITNATGIRSNSLTLIFLLPLKFQSLVNEEILRYLQEKNIDGYRVDYLSGAFQIIESDLKIKVTGHKLL